MQALGVGHEIHMQMEGRASVKSTLEDTVHSEVGFPLQSLAENTSACVLEEVLGGVETPAVQFTGSQELKKELEAMKSDKMALTGT